MSHPEPNAPAELIPVTPEFVKAFQALLAAANVAAEELRDMENSTFAKGGVLDRHRANELAAKRLALIETSGEARNVLQAQFDKYAVARNAVTTVKTLRT